MNEYGAYVIAISLLVIGLSVSQLILRMIFRKEHRIEDMIVEGKKYRLEYGTYDPDDYIKSKSYIKSNEWLKQRNKGIRLNKKIKLRRYIGDSKNIIT